MKKPKRNEDIKRDEKGQLIIEKDDLCYSEDTEETNGIEPIFTLTYGEVVPEGKILKSFDF